MNKNIKVSDNELMKITGADKKLLEIFKLRQQEARAQAQQFKNNFFKKEIRVLGVSGSARDRFDMAQQDSTTEWLLEKALDQAKKLGAKTELLSLRKFRIEPCKACYSTTNAQCHFKCTCYPEGPAGDDMTNKIYDKVMKADVIIFATPVNNFKISSMMSLFLDRLISMDGSLKPALEKDPKNKLVNIMHTKFIENTARLDFGSGFLHRFTGKIAGIITSGHEQGAALAISQLYMTLSHYGMLFPPFSNMYAVNTVCQATYEDAERLEVPCHEQQARILATNLMTAAKVLKRKGDFWWTYDGRSN